MTIAEFADLTRRSTRTIRRWIREGALPARRVPLGTDFSAFRYELNRAHVSLAWEIHEAKMKRLSGVSPGLWRHMRQRLGSRDLLADRRLAMGQGRPGAGFGDDWASIRPDRCPKCGYWLRKTGR